MIQFNMTFKIIFASEFKNSTCTRFVRNEAMDSTFYAPGGGNKKKQGDAITKEQKCFFNKE